MRADALAARYEVNAVGIPHFGVMVDGTLEVASRFSKMLVVALRVDERYVLNLCRAAEERSIKTEVFWRGPQEGQAVLSFTRDPSWPFFVPEKVTGEIESPDERDDDNGFLYDPEGIPF